MDSATYLSCRSIMHHHLMHMLVTSLSAWQSDVSLPTASWTVLQCWVCTLHAIRAYLHLFDHVCEVTTDAGRHGAASVTCSNSQDDLVRPVGLPVWQRRLNITHNKYALIHFHYEGDLDNSQLLCLSCALCETSAAGNLSCLIAWHLMTYCACNKITVHM